VDIDSVLESFALNEKYKFHNVKCQCIDFQCPVKFGGICMPTELGRIKLLDIYENKKKDTLGVIVNTDYTGNRGIHWFSLFVNMRTLPWTIEYFNSSGKLPMTQITAWQNKMQNELKKDNKTSKIVIANRLQHQRDTNSECGMYAIYYIYKRLEGTPFELFDKRRITDREMIEMRRRVFKEK